MLNRNRLAPSLVSRQRGVVLLISLIVFIVLSLAGLALLRSVDTTSLITGNLAFRQAAVRAADIATDQALNTLFRELSSEELTDNQLLKGYVASMPENENPIGTKAWEVFWKTKIAGARAIELAPDAIGNTVAYTIQRMCRDKGMPEFAHCVTAPTTWQTPGTNLGVDVPPIPSPPQYYYRITTRVVGPRNTTVFIQTAVVR